MEAMPMRYCFLQQEEENVLACSLLYIEVDIQHKTPCRVIRRRIGCRQAATGAESGADDQQGWRRTATQ